GALSQYAGTCNRSLMTHMRSLCPYCPKRDCCHSRNLQGRVELRVVSANRMVANNNATTMTSGQTRRAGFGPAAGHEDKFVPGGNAHPPSQTDSRGTRTAPARYIPLRLPNSL